MSELLMFTDGACKANGKKNSQASYAYYFPQNKEWSYAAKVPENEPQTNNRGELKAIYEGILKAMDKCGNPSEFTLHIYTDSSYSKDCLTKWLHGWLKNNWKSSEGNDVKHRDLIEGSTKLLVKFKSFIITWVKAHTGNQDDISLNNEIVDKLATEILLPPKDISNISKISTSDNVFNGLDFKIMGGPIEQDIITNWCFNNIKELDRDAMKVALFSAFQKTLIKKGYDTEIQIINKKKFIRLKMNSLKQEDNIIIKQEETE
jgi:ribonuclease HI